MAKVLEAVLPAGIKDTDLLSPSWKSKIARHYDLDFELWYITAFGWVIPTLFIRNPGRRNRLDAAPRTYAVAVEGGKSCRVGLGPHVLRRVTVYVTAANKGRLQYLLDLKRDGAVTSNEIRDRISTRRAIGTQMRAAGRNSWMW